MVMASRATPYAIDGVQIQSKPARSRTARRGRAGYVMDEMDHSLSLGFMTADEADFTKGSGADADAASGGEEGTGGDAPTSAAARAAGKTSGHKHHFEYLDHTADVQLHSWGPTLKDAFESVAVAMFNYMTDVSRVSVDERQTLTFTVEAGDQEKLLFRFLDELLYHFVEDEHLVCADVQLVEADWAANKLVVKARGETFDMTKHEKGTEIKAITYSAARIEQRDGLYHVYVIVDI